MDHWPPYDKTRHTRLDELRWLCVWHHYLVTYKGYRLEGSPGDWRWLPPQGAAAEDEPEGSTEEAAGDELAMALAHCVRATGGRHRSA